MKKITFTLFFLAFYAAYSQTVVWSDNFNDLDISDWTITNTETTDDGFDWNAQFDANPNVEEEVLTSVSYDLNGDVNLTPDNWAISPAIDLSNASGTITLKWKAAAPDTEFDNENYSVYIANSSTINDLESGTSMSYNLTGVNMLTEQTIDISSFAGEPNLYVAFRHHNAVPDEGFIISIDDVLVEAETVLGLEDIALNGLKYWQNRSTKALHFKSSINIKSIALYDTSGKKLMHKNTNRKNIEIETDHLAVGAYITKVNTDNATKLIKVVLN